MPEKYSTAQSKVKSRGILRPFIPAAWREALLADLSGPELEVLLAYLTHANGDDLAWPSLRSLSKTTGYGINAVKKARRLLTGRGLLAPVEQERKAGQFSRKVFRVYYTVDHKERHGTAALSTVAPLTVAPSNVGHKECQEGSPSEGLPLKGKPREKERSASPRYDSPH